MTELFIVKYLHRFVSSRFLVKESQTWAAGAGDRPDPEVRTTLDDVISRSRNELISTVR